MSKSLKDKLPLYSPPESVWENIEQGLNETPLQEAIRKLPVHEPPTQTWFDVSAQLPHSQRSWWRYAAAAVVILLIGVVGYISLQRSNENAIISYSQEKLNPKTMVLPNETIEKQYAHLQALCEERVTVCEKPEFKALKQELDDLTVAGNQLKEALGAYNTDAALSAQLSEIEQERADILRKLNERIL
ncbi:anti-sigma factor [Runella sp.]|uniref:anti-sigma factor n=1 Tax=Runella sp. TaxID=1960881 RepID=UPI003D100564